MTPSALAENSVACGDSTELLGTLTSESVHLILSDIPYGIGAEDWDVLHDNTNSAFLGSSPAQERAGAVFRKRGKPLNGWSEADRDIPRQYYEWCAGFAKEWLRVLKPGGSAILFAGRRLSHRCTAAFEDAGFTYKDMLAWLREKAPHRAQRLSVVYERRGNIAAAKKWAGWRIGNLRPTFEPILWFVKPYKIGHTIASNVLEHAVGAFHEAAYVPYAKQPDNVLSVRSTPEDSGMHPTQKPVALMRALIELTTCPAQIVVDPFCGSGTTLVAAAALGRRFIGIDIDAEYCRTARRRLDAMSSQIDIFRENTR
jgi:site-specific DNA-methyltransferase (adenine-specific)